jgi:hypothetical protein
MALSIGAVGLGLLDKIMQRPSAADELAYNRGVPGEGLSPEVEHKTAEMRRPSEFDSTNVSKAKAVRALDGDNTRTAEADRYAIAVKPGTAAAAAPGMACVVIDPLTRKRQLEERAKSDPQEPDSKGKRKKQQRGFYRR